MPKIGLWRLTVTTAALLFALGLPARLGVEDRREPGDREDVQARPDPPFVLARAGSPDAPLPAADAHDYRGAALVASDVYEGVDLLLLREPGEAAYGLVIRPNARADGIRLSMAEADRLEIDEAGDLLVHQHGRLLRQRRPTAYQQTPAGRVEVRADYRVGPDGDVRLAFGRYDRARPLVILTP